MTRLAMDFSRSDGASERAKISHPAPVTGGRERLVVGLSGKMGAGKTTAGEFLKAEGFHYGRFSQVIAEMLRDRARQPTREALQELGQEIHEQNGQRWLCHQLTARLPTKANLVIDGLRFSDDHHCLAETYGRAFLHIHIEAPDSVRRERYVREGGTTERFGAASAHTVESGIEELSKLANHRISNAASVASFHTGLKFLIRSTRPLLIEEARCR